MKPLCIYHGNCADGFGAAWAVRKALGDGVEFHGGVYQMDPPDVSGRHVILVDFSYKRPVLEEMAKKARSILILDHHKSAAEDLAGYEAPICWDGEQWWSRRALGSVAAIFDMDRSGAMITWEYFHPGEPAPTLISHIQDRDLWQFKLDGTREIQAAVFSYPYDFEVWDRLMDMNVHELRGDGAAIERKHFKDIREFIEAAGYRMEIAGHDVPVLNAPYFWSSDAAHIMAEGEPFAACYWDTPDGRVFSLRSSDDGMDVSQIATQFGGGGHQHAAGYSIPSDSDTGEE